MIHSDSYSPIIGGRAVAGPARFPVFNPADGAPFAECDRTDGGMLDAAVAAASAAFPQWSRSLPDRVQALRYCSGVFRENLEDWSRLLTREQGKPLAKARAELALAADWFSWTAELPVHDEFLTAASGAKVRLRRRPFGIVAAITPWNYPVILAVCKIAPALLAGNTVVLKPSEYTPLTTIAFVGALQRVLPPGVLNVVTGDAEVGRALVEHPAIHKISFTGSISGGQSVLRSASSGIKRVTLELGGNDPAIVLAGADPDEVAPAILALAFENSGQFCAAIKRLYVHSSLHQPILERLGRLARDLRVGPGDDPATQIGPITHSRQLERICDLVEAARAGGATFVAGGHRIGTRGYFFAPTVLSGKLDGAAIVQEEQFGPVLPVLTFEDIDEMLARVNASRYGLGASVWSTDQLLAESCAERIEAGTVWINQHAALGADIPFGGVKQSGLGYEYGRWGLDEYLQLRVVNAKNR